MSGKHKRDRAAEHRAKQETKQRKRDAEGWTGALTGIGETFAQSVARRGGVIHGDGIGRQQFLDTGRMSYNTFNMPPRAGKQALADAIARSADYGARKYGGPVYSSVVEHMNASHVRFVETTDELEELGFETRSLLYDEARGLFGFDTDGQWFTDPGLGTPLFVNSPGAEAYISPRVEADPEARFFAHQLAYLHSGPYETSFSGLLGTGYVDNKIAAPRRSQRMGFVGVGTLRLGARVLDRAVVSDAHFKSHGYRTARTLGNRHDFKRWVRNELAPVVRFANDSAAEMVTAGDVLEGHMIELYNTTDIARRRELEMFVAEAHAARADARRRTLVALLEVCTLDVALAWSRATETLNEYNHRRAEVLQARQAPRREFIRGLMPPHVERLTTANARVDHVSIGPGGGISVGYTVR